MHGHRGIYGRTCRGYLSRLERTRPLSYFHVTPIQYKVWGGVRRPSALSASIKLNQHDSVLYGTRNTARFGSVPTELRPTQDRVWVLLLALFVVCGIFLPCITSLTQLE